MTWLRTELAFAFCALVFVLIVVFGVDPALRYAVTVALRHLVTN